MPNAGTISPNKTAAQNTQPAFACCWFGGVLEARDAFPTNLIYLSRPEVRARNERPVWNATRLRISEMECAGSCGRKSRLGEIERIRTKNRCGAHAALSKLFARPLIVAVARTRAVLTCS